MKDVATTCVLRAVNAFKYVCGRGSTVHRPLAGFGEGETGKGKEGKGKEEGVGEERKARGGKIGPPKQKSRLRIAVFLTF